jgi:hypothetical protein
MSDSFSNNDNPKNQEEQHGKNGPKIKAPVKFSQQQWSGYFTC